MTDDAALLRAVLLEPDAVEPRLVYADWLEERCDPRGEFIRVQVALADAPEPDPALVRREEELLREHGRLWRGVAHQAAYQSFFRRGFVEEVTITAENFVRHGAAILDAHPVRLARLMRLNGGRLARLAATGVLGKISALHLSDNVIDTGVARLLARIPDLAGLRRLRVRRSRLTDRGLEHLAESRHVAGLRELEIDGNMIGDAGVVALASSPHFAGLRRLDLSGNAIGAYGIQALANSPHLRDLEYLNVTGQVQSTRGKVNPRGGNRHWEALKERFGAACVHTPDDQLSLASAPAATASGA